MYNFDEIIKDMDFHNKRVFDMVSNFDKIIRHMDFPDEDVFYFLQIIKRRKENPDMLKNEIQLQAYHITSIDQLERLEDEITDFCDYHNARAYFHLNKRSFKRIGLETLKIIADYVANEEYKSIKKAFNSACGKFSSDPIKKWILDVDFFPQNMSLMSHLDKFLREIEPIGEDKIIDIIKTKNGLHIITKPFNLKAFKEILPQIEVHKNNPTLLYSPPK